ncbi:MULTISPECIES: hypothetical protein [unclassified Arthrobacter]|uniref:hypothetical protein n=1 Tax=unclassified Arthrobacter TaxID=235627 RepID=UPI002E064F89|nr:MULTISPECIES: hypothetical protein [unclassified Arthrobacter]MEC5193293.1 hypothetical protein [Arthrobacter sp. MP_M4]MEC5204759.1 hypothetical protein [Arthrobacter sp. MP_M7]
MPIEKPPAPGEQKHQLGEDGTRRAKLWLDSTMRVRHSYTNMDDNGPSKLAFEWPYGGESYSYDLGGVFRGAPFNNQTFVAESKNYKDANDQGTHFDKFLAQTYCTIDRYSRMADHFMWITWAPFRIKTWTKLASDEKVRAALMVHANKVFNTTDHETVAGLIDQEIVDRITETLWMVVLSPKQEQLVISGEDRAELYKIMQFREFQEQGGS